jgi:hypothetical protein
MGLPREVIAPSLLIRLLMVASLAVGAVAFAAVPAQAAPVWKLAAPAPLTPNEVGSLYSVACPAVDSCYAVGSRSTSGGMKGLVEHWDGAAWTTMSNPLPAGSYVTYFGVSCASNVSCMAVGQRGRYVSGGDHRFFAARWDGVTWSAATFAGNTKGTLTSVSCPSATTCFAAGFSDPNFRGVIKKWNGSGWSTMPLPAGSVFLNAISCRSVSFCFVVGRGSSQVDARLALRWNGTKWSMTKTPGNTGDQTALNAVSCASTKLCVAAGSGYKGSGLKLVANRWNGTSWSSSTPVNPSGPSANLLGMSCPTTTGCVAVGIRTGSGPKALIERTNGSTWSIMTSPNPPNGVELFGVSCPNPTHCIAVGMKFVKSRTVPLILRYA